MDWSFKTVGACSAISQEPFSPGDAIICILYKAANGELSRLDLHPEDLVPEFEAPATIIAKWSFKVRPKSVLPSEQARQMLLSVEDLFLALHTDAVPNRSSEEQSALKQLLALILERKRILKPQGLPKNYSQTYLHTKTGVMYVIDIMPPSETLLQQLKEQIGQLL